MTGTRIILLLFLLTGLAVTTVQACDCGEQLPQFTKEETEKYGLIFIGKIDSIQPGERTALAWFTGTELYRGLATEHLPIQFDNYTSCRMEFEIGQTWMIYAVKDSVTYRWRVDYCSRSRRYPGQGEIDQYTVYSGLTFAEERKFLTAMYPPSDFLTNAALEDVTENDKTVIDSKRELVHADNRQKLFLIIGSLIAMIIIYLLVKKLGK